MTNTPNQLAHLTLSAGINTAFTAPSGTAILLNHVAIATNISGTASAYNIHVLAGSTASAKTWFPITAVTGGDGLLFNGAFMLKAASHGLIVSASSGSAFDVIVCGLQVT